MRSSSLIGNCLQTLERWLYILHLEWGIFPTSIGHLNTSLQHLPHCKHLPSRSSSCFCTRPLNRYMQICLLIFCFAILIPAVIFMSPQINRAKWYRYPVILPDQESYRFFWRIPDALRLREWPSRKVPNASITPVIFERHSTNTSEPVRELNRQTGCLYRR